MNDHRKQGDPAITRRLYQLSQGSASIDEILRTEPLTESAPSDEDDSSISELNPHTSNQIRLREYVADAPQQMEFDETLDFAEDYLSIQKKPQEVRTYVLDQLEKELISRGKRLPEQDYVPEELSEDTQEYDISSEEFRETTAEINKERLTRLIDSYCADYATKR